jgi:hypothetical protein
MIIAVIAVRMMEMTCHEVVEVIPVRDGFVPAARTVDVACLVASAAV